MIKTDLVQNFTKVVEDYRKLSGKTVHETLQKQGGELVFALQVELKKIRPKKGEIRTKLTERLKSGKMILIRESARNFVDQKIQKNDQSKKPKAFTLTYEQMLVKREIAIRESAVAFLQASSIYKKILPDYDVTVSRKGSMLSNAKVEASGDYGEAGIVWPDTNRMSRQAALGMTIPHRGGPAIDRAIQAATANAKVYIAKKQAEIMAQFGASMKGKLNG